MTSCRKDTAELESIKKYIHVSHTRSVDNDEMVEDIAQLPMEDYDVTMLGGDMMFLTSQKVEPMEIVDEVFDLQNPNTLWSLGNHDYNDLDLVEEYTGRNNYYTYHKDGIAYLVLDSQMDTSKIIGNQLEFVNTVLDTISESSHLIILTHHLIWMDDNGYLSTIVDSISNAPLSDCWYCVNPNNFYEDLYPRLVTLEKNGIEVLCIGGDVGYFVDGFEFQTEDGVDYLGSGVGFVDHENNKVLEFYHDLSSESLTWEFQRVKDLVR